MDYFKNFLVFVSNISGCVSVSAFALLVGIPIGIASSAIGLKIGVITAKIASICQLSKKKKKKERKKERKTTIK